jgi:hypothetical protein
MSNVIDDDMDDFFRRASERYPLRTDSSDWDRLAAALKKEPSLILSTAVKEDRRKNRFFWLFLLLPLGGYFAWHASSHNSAGQAPAVGSLAANPSKKVLSDAATITSSTKGASRAAANTRLAKGGAYGAASEAPQGMEPASVSAPVNDKQRGSRSSGEVVGQQASTAQALRQQQASSGEPIEGMPAITGQIPGRPPSTRETSGSRRTPAPHAAYQPAPEQVPSSLFPRDEHPARVGNSPSGRVPYSGTAEQTHPSGFDPFSVQRAPTRGNPTLGVQAPSPVSSLVAGNKSPGGGSLANTNTATANTKSQKKSIGKSSFFYAGLLAAPDLSTVKMQAVKGVGTTAGLLLGYQFNPSWAVETGIYLDRKKYYTEGEYFNTKNGPVLYGYLNNVNGICNMIELPINVRYNLGTGQKMKWFATAGMSTYLMSNESYVYELMPTTGSGVGGVWDAKWTNKKPSQYFFSVINVSVGFEQKLGKIGNLRLEPYLRIPVSGIGSGSLPIMSAGLNIGITRKIL